MIRHILDGLIVNGGILAMALILLTLTACTGPTTLCEHPFECDRAAGDAPSDAPAAASQAGAAPSPAAPAAPSGECE